MTEMLVSSPFSTGTPIDDDRAASASAAERHEVRGKRRSHRRQRFDAPDDVLDAPQLGVRLARRSRPACRNASTSAAWYRTRRRTAEIQNVRTNSSAPTSATSANAICATTSVLRRNDFATLLPRVPFLQRLVQIAARDLQRREQSEDDRGSGGDGDRVDDRRQSISQWM